MQDVELVLFAIASMLTAFARLATPRNRRARKHHERLGSKMRPERRDVPATRAQDEWRYAWWRMTGMGEVKTSNDAAFTRSQPYGLGAGLERSSPPNHVSASMPNNTLRRACKQEFCTQM